MPALPETDLDALRRAYRFVRDDEGEGDEEEEKRTRLVREYESALFREYALADLSRYETKQIGLRWRTKPECQSGKGEATCGALDCSAADGLSTFELPFVYREGGGREDKTTTLVKLRVCPTCATKVELISKKGEKKKKKKKKKRDEGERADNAKRKREGAGCTL